MFAGSAHLWSVHAAGSTPGLLGLHGAKNTGGHCSGNIHTASAARHVGWGMGRCQLQRCTIVWYAARSRQRHRAWCMHHWCAGVCVCSSCCSDLHVLQAKQSIFVVWVPLGHNEGGRVPRTLLMLLTFSLNGWADPCCNAVPVSPVGCP
jgi:hypothetical protein